MGMKSVNSWNKSHIFLFLAPISHIPQSPVVKTPTLQQTGETVFGTLIDKNHVYSFFILTFAFLQKNFLLTESRKL